MARPTLPVLAATLGVLALGTAACTSTPAAKTEKPRPLSSLPTAVFPTPPPAVPSQSAPAEAENKNHGSVTKAKFDEITTGMTVKEVLDLIGQGCDKTSQTDIAGSTSASYTCRQGQWGANAVFSFTNGTLTSKAQSSLS
ncbi:hypothetical protein [Streptomyces sp. cg36]|uniref:hypothetical protein n=1 Tax=Streptomyces sp. cg36 TaxID=3238798 RepID=UPI0034E2C587